MVVRVLLLFLVLPAGVAAETFHVAVAANFQAPARELATLFGKRSGHRARLSFGSTGQLYAQVRAGAPYAALLAADAERPARLEAEGLAVPGSRFTYAIGRLVLYSPTPGLALERGAILSTGGYRHLAIADPRLAPYGAAAWQVMERLAVLDAARPRLVKGQSIAQAWQFVASGNAEFGFVALAQLGNAPEGSRWPVPAELHDPIEQQAVLVADNEPARGFLEFLRSAEARRLIEGYGYAVPRGPS